MFKKIKVLLAALVMLCAGSAFADDFDWSQCWCNYGGGIKEGNILVNIDGGINYVDLTYSAYNGFWFIPTVMVDVQYAKPIWKLPFAFGGYAGVRAAGYKVYTYENGSYVYKDVSKFTIFGGAEASYHVMLPPKNLDVYAVNRIGFGIPIVTGSYAAPYVVTDFVDFNISFGANYFFSDNFGLNLELGAPVSKFGITLKF